MPLWKIILLILLEANLIFGTLQVIIKKEKINYNDKNLGWFWGVLGWSCVIVCASFAS